MMKTGLRRLLALALGAGLLTANTYAAATTFTDVPTTYWGYYYIDRAATEGLVSGIGDNQYGPEQTLSNAQFVTMICNMFYKTAVAANQNSSGQWWYPYMAAAYSAGILSNTTVAQRRAAAGGFTNATDFADYLVTKGVPFRDAHAVVGEAVAYCIMNDKALDDCTMEEFKSFSPLIEEDIYDKISIDTCIHKRQTIGAPGPQQVQAAIDANQLWLDGAKATHEAQAEKLAF